MSEVQQHALLVTEPWASHLIEGRKTWEMRTRNTKVRGRIGLIRSKSGIIIGSVNLVDCVAVSIQQCRRNKSKHLCEIPLLENYGKGKQLYAWVMENPVKFDESIPYDHPQGAVIWVNVPTF